MIRKKIITMVATLGVLMGPTGLQMLHALTIEKDKATALELDKSATEVFVANPDVADAQMPRPPILYLYGKKVGQTTVYVKDGKGKPKEIPVHVTHNLAQLLQNVRLLHPNDEVQAVSTPTGIMLMGTVSSPKASADIEKVAQQYIEDKEKVINHLSINSSTQVMLKVKIAEVRRDVLNSLGFNWSSNIPGAAKHFQYGILTGPNPLAVGSTVTGAFGSLASPFVAANRSINADTTFGSVGAFAKEGKNSYSAVLDALNSEGMGTVLAEPTLISLSGESASFLVGGEFPYVVPAQNLNSTPTIQFKEFGVVLSFIPTIRANNSINLHVRPEVSELDYQNGVTIGGFTVPGLKSRRSDTTVELASGQSMAIAGLFRDDASNLVKELPGLGDLPIIGALFKSTRFQRNQTELVIIITPYVVEGAKPSDLGSPTDSLRQANVLEMLIMNRVNDPTPAGEKMQSVGHVHGAGGFYVE